MAIKKVTIFIQNVCYFVFEAHASPAWPSRSVTKYRTFEIAKFASKMPIWTNCNKILTKNAINSGLSGSDAANGPNTGSNEGVSSEVYSSL